MQNFGDKSIPKNVKMLNELARENAETEKMLSVCKFFIDEDLGGLNMFDLTVLYQVSKSDKVSSERILRETFLEKRVVYNSIERLWMNGLIRRELLPNAKPVSDFNYVCQLTDKGKMLCVRFLMKFKGA